MKTPKTSTGPKTSRGKAYSRFNALKHGLLGKKIMFTPDGKLQDEGLLAELRSRARNTDANGLAGCKPLHSWVPCGIIHNGYLDNDASLNLIKKITLSHAEAGSDMVAPASMLDGQIQTMRQALDAHGFQNLPIMAYSAKFASKLYDPFFKEGTHSTMLFGDKRTHQMDFCNSDEAMREIALDIEEGADIVMVKPALFYLDVVYRAKQEFKMPVAVYDVSGEYAMIDAAARLGRLDRDAIMLEALTCMKRAGADIITYFAKRAAELLRREEHSGSTHFEPEVAEAKWVI